MALCRAAPRPHNVLHRFEQSGTAWEKNYVSSSACFDELPEMTKLANEVRKKCVERHGEEFAKPRKRL